MIESIILDMAVMNPACVVEWPGPASHTQTSTYLAQSPVRKVVNGQGGQGLNHSRAASPCPHFLIPGSNSGPQSSQRAGWPEPGSQSGCAPM